MILEREEGGGRDREREKHRCERETSIGLPLVHTLTMYGACNLGMCPDRESNSPVSGVQNDAPTN